jgi:hypothetical protein
MDFYEILNSGVLLKSVNTLVEQRLIRGTFLKPTEGRKDTALQWNYEKCSPYIL